MKKGLLTVLLLVAASALWVLAQGSTGLYTKAQADLGSNVYADQCAMCHGSKLEGVSAPALTGTVLAADWGDAQSLYEFYAESMPPMAPGGLKEAEYLAIMAFILRENGFPAGETPLVAKPEVLSAIKFKAN
jgi:mono/diheme cytochrome c family protein